MVICANRKRRRDSLEIHDAYFGVLAIADGFDEREEGWERIDLEEDDVKDADATFATDEVKADACAGCDVECFLVFLDWSCLSFS